MKKAPPGTRSSRWGLDTLRHAPTQRRNLQGRGHQRRLCEGTAAVCGEPHRHSSVYPKAARWSTAWPRPFP